MNNILLTDASFSEVLARVAFRLIERRRSFYPYTDTEDIDLMRRLARQLAQRGWPALSFWVHAYLVRSDQGEKVEFTRTAFIMRARLGLDFRSVAFFEYKATRRRPPPVSNTGGSTRATKRGRA